MLYFPRLPRRIAPAAPSVAAGLARRAEERGAVNAPANDGRGAANAPANNDLTPRNV